MTNQEIRTRFFAAHLGANVLHTNISGYSQYLNPDWGVLGNDVIVRNGCIFDMYAIEQCVLILTDLSSITDKHLREVARIMGYTECYKIIYHNKCIHFYYEGNSVYIDVDFFNSHTTDYLRSLNYCLPFMGLDPIKEGWAILDDKNEEE